MEGGLCLASVAAAGRDTALTRLAPRRARAEIAARPCVGGDAGAARQLSARVRLSEYAAAAEVATAQLSWHLGRGRPANSAGKTASPCREKQRLNHRCVCRLCTHGES